MTEACDPGSMIGELRVLYLFGLSEER
jgi:hypothetical protein